MYSTLFKLWLPIALHQLIFASLNLLTVTMVGQLGETAVAAVGLANQMIFLLMLLLFGVTSGSAIFIAQFWGSQDVRNIRRVLGICLGLSLISASAFALIALLAPESVLAIYSTDTAVIALGSEYLRLVSSSYVAMAVTLSYTMALRSTGNVRLPAIISVCGGILGAGLNYGLIFGEWGFPALGVEGSAIGTMAARWVECILFLILTYSGGSVVAASLREMTALDVVFAWDVLKTVLPVTLNEIFWSVGISTYHLIYGRMGTQAVAAVNIAVTIEMLAFVPFVGLANASAIIIGKNVGAGGESEAFENARRFLRIVLGFGMIVGVLLYGSAGSALGLYKVDAATHEFARSILGIMAVALWLKVANMLFIVGILRAGGDARASAFIDVLPLWLIGIPAAAAGAFIFGLPVPWVYVLTLGDEATKFGLALWRVVSKKWIRNLVRRHSGGVQRAEAN